MPILKQTVVYLILSALVIVSAHYIRLIMMYVFLGYAWLTRLVSPYFIQGDAGFFICKVLLVVLTPVLIAAVPALIYRLIKGKNMPYFFTAVWCLWIFLVLGILLIH